MNNLLWSLAGVLLVSLVSLIGAVSLVFKEKVLSRLLIFLVAFSAGSLIGSAFFHLLPESLGQTNDPIRVFVFLLFGFCLFFLLERILRWHHCHNSEECETHKHLGWMNLVGDGVHNLIDGMIIFAAFTAGPILGIPVLLAIILHEIPQELSDFGVLLYSGFSKLKALAYNLVSALMSFFGVLIAFVFYNYNQNLSGLLVPFAAGGFIYIAASDLIPELHREKKLGSSILSFLTFLVALVFMYAVKALFE